MRRTLTKSLHTFIIRKTAQRAHYQYMVHGTWYIGTWYMKESIVHEQPHLGGVKQQRKILLLTDIIVDTHKKS